MTKKWTIRPERSTDPEDIRDVLVEAFGRSKEALLVDKLRLEPAYLRDLSLVGLDHGNVVGHVLFFPVNIVNEKGEHPCLSLAPLAVHPECQGKGLGSRLVETGMNKARETGFAAVVVLGDPSFYGRFGFVPASMFGIESPWNLEGCQFMAKELVPGALEHVSGRVVYSHVFNEAD
ncbi:MAG: N-acetyltransferase [Bacteroidales bacterium]